MVSDLNDILAKQDFGSEEDTRALVFICANNPNFELPFALLTRYPVFDTYADYWEKGATLLEKNRRLLGEIQRPLPELPALRDAEERISPSVRLSFQKKAIRKYLKKFPVKSSY